MNKLLINCCIVGLLTCPSFNGAAYFVASYSYIQKSSADSSDSTANERWAYIFNTKIEKIDSLYLSNAVLVTANGEIYNNVSDRNKFYIRMKKNIGEIKSITTIRKEELLPNLSFEIGYFIAAKNKKFKHFIIWKKTGNVFFRELEIISECSTEIADTDGINNARNEWMNWCNKHDAYELVSNAYFDNAVYYNNSRTIIGTASIAKEYQYMNNPAYQLKLTPMILESVSENMSFEIGQCSGSYHGKYALIWGRSDDGNWKIIFDSN